MREGRERVGGGVRGGDKWMVEGWMVEGWMVEEWMVEGWMFEELMWKEWGGRSGSSLSDAWLNWGESGIVEVSDVKDRLGAWEWGK